MSILFFDGRRIVLGVTGSIAAYKACALASRLTQAGALVDVVMTEAATRFVAPLTFQALTGRAVYADMWQQDPDALPTHIAHVGLAEGADLLVIAPATAQTIAKLALGLADNLLTLTALAAKCPLLIAPAMDAGMYAHPATQAHVETLRERGAHIAGPGVGRMASGLTGPGRLLEPEELLGHCRLALGASGALAERRVVVTAGPTRESLDPVRYLSNYSSGKQGFALAQAALDRGAAVTLVAGPVVLPTPVGAERVNVENAEEMRDATVAHACADPPADALLMAAAVADFRPVARADDKIKKQGEPPPIDLEFAPDILGEVAAAEHRPSVVIGFAAESRDLLANARAKLEAKRLDLIVANDITAPDAGFAVDTNSVTFVTPDGAEPLPLLSKAEVAARVLDWLAARL